MSLASVGSYDASRVPARGAHAVVLGASVAGLLAARVLADAFEQVTVVDRDPLGLDGDATDKGVAARRGVPQGQHPHALLRAGQVVMEALFPGFVDDLVASGAVVLDFSREFTFHVADDVLARGSGDMPMYFASRPLLEGLLRARLGALDGVRVEGARQVAGVLADGDGGAITGVSVLDEGRERSLPADLVVDATGRASHAAGWLEQFGYTPPAVAKVHVDLAYRTCQVARPPDDRRMILLAPAPPRARAGALVPIEGDRWLVTLIGLHGDHPPADLEGLRAFADSLPMAEFREALDARPLVNPEIAYYRFPTNTRHRYERCKAFPRGVLTVGDAIASFNPIYGQGMSVAALEALVLHHTLAEHDRDDVAPRFYARAAPLVDGAWNMAAGGDFLFPQTHGTKPRGTDVVNRYITRLQRTAHADAEVADAFRRVAGMEEPPTALFKPGIVWRVLRPGGPAPAGAPAQASP